MPVVTFARGVDSSPTRFLSAFEDMALSGHIVRGNASLAVLTIGTQKFTLTGSDFTFAREAGTKVLTGGQLDKVVLFDGGLRQMALTNLALDLGALHGATIAEKAGTDLAAIERLILPLGWAYHGNHAADTLLPDAASADGVRLNLSGDDHFTLAGGPVETLFTGDGKDTVFGGKGHDVLYGGTGRDILHGDGADDSLIGGNQGDVLFGEQGNDRFYGGAGDDVLNGGRGVDTLTGEQGNDQFVFRLGDGHDEIRDFDLDHDVINLPDTPYIFVQGVLIYGPGTDLGDIQGKDTIVLIDINPNDVHLVTII